MVRGSKHGFIHLFGIESSIPDPQLGSRKHVLKQTAEMSENSQQALVNEAFRAQEAEVLRWQRRTWEVLKYTSWSSW